MYDTDLKTILTENLEWLDIQNCTGLTILSLKNISLVCSHLEVLHFSNDLIPKRVTKTLSEYLILCGKLRNCHISQFHFDVNLLSFLDENIWSLESFKSLFLDEVKYDSFEEFQSLQQFLSLVQSLDARFISSKNYLKELEWYMKAAEKGNTDAQFIFGMNQFLSFEKRKRRKKIEGKGRKKKGKEKLEQKKKENKREKQGKEIKQRKKKNKEEIKEEKNKGEIEEKRRKKKV